MLIDWFTVVAQIVNFLVLVGLMKHFLYERLVHAMDARERRIAARLAEAEQKNREIDERIEQSRREAGEMEKQRDQMITQAKQEAENQRKQMVEKARESVRSLEAKWREDVERERSAFLAEIRSRAANEILLIVRRVLTDLASADLEQSAVQSFLAKLPSIDVASLREELVLRTGTELDASEKQRIEEALEHRLGEPVRLKFERAPEMTWGLELRSDGRRIGWNPESYVESLEENLRGALEHRKASSNGR